MSSQARINASRANGKLSRGPKTEEGKRRSSQNARRHGLHSRNLPLDAETAARFREDRQRLVDLYQPQDEIERCLIDRMAFCHSRHYEAMAKETALIGHAIRAQSEQRPEIVQKEPAVRAFLAVGDLLNRDRALEVLHRLASHYSFRCERAYEALMDRRNTCASETKLTFPGEDFVKRTYRASAKG
jgi:hypothetical protein